MINIKLNKKIYPKPVIEQAISDWQEFADFKIEETENYFEIKINPTNPQENLEYEFMNYIIELM